jgi:hypothetical protein
MNYYFKNKIYEKHYWWLKTKINPLPNMEKNGEK